MTTLNWLLIVVCILAIIPAWVIALAALVASRRPREPEPSARYRAYVDLLHQIHGAMNAGRIDNGAAYAASIRELGSYPEYRDLSLLYLEEITITGSNKFDHIMKTEIKAVEEALLEKTSG